MAASALPVWQLQLHDSWMNLPVTISVALESAFTDPSVTTTNVTIPIVGADVTHPFNANTLRWGSQNVRRGATSPSKPHATAEFWCDTHWQAYDEFSTAMICDATLYKRPQTVVYANGNQYVVHLGDDMFQVSLNSICRPIRVKGMDTTATHIADPGALAITFKDEDVAKIPSVLCCPITHLPMQNPVIAADGATYEHDAIERWFATSRKSPATGKTVTSKLCYPNFVARDMLCHVHKELYGAAPPTAAPSAGGSSKVKDKKKRKNSVVMATCQVCDEQTLASEMTMMDGEFYCANCVGRDDSD